MTDKEERYQQQINAYLSNNLSEAEEIAFIRSLRSDTALLSQFQLALLLQHAVADETQNETPAFESATAHLNRVNEIVNPVADATEDTPKAKEISFVARNRSWLVAASVLLIISLFFLYTKYKPAGSKGNDIALHKDSSLNPVDTNGHKNQNKEILLAENKTAIAYKQLYSRYKSSTDPAEISIYLLDYYEKNYDEIISTESGDYQTRGREDSAKLAAYMHLYKGLAYMEQDENKKSMAQLEMVLNKAPQNTPQFYAAQWYKTLLLLKTNNATGAILLAEKIVGNSNSRYRQNAKELLEFLK